MRRILAVLLVVAALFCGCSSGQGASSSSAPLTEPENIGGSTKREAVQSGEVQFTAPEYGAPVAEIETDLGTIRLVLYPQYAPLAVENFTTLAENGYYNHTEFHRVVEAMAIQAGRPADGGDGESIWGTPFATERSDALHHYAGALCMAPQGNVPNSHQSQFYIVSTPQGTLSETALARMRSAGMREAVVSAYAQAGGAPYLDNTDTVFGQVIDGMDVVDEIAHRTVDENEHPKRPVQILSVRVTRYTQGTPPASSLPAASVSVPDIPASDVLAADETAGG